MKTEKAEDAELSKEEIGQGHNHLQWVAEHHPEYELLGLIYVAKCGDVSIKASPSPMMFQGTVQAVEAIWTQFLG